MVRPEANPVDEPDRAPLAGAARRFLRVVPLAFVTYSLAFVDRVNYGFGAAAGMATSLGITEQDSALLGAVFFGGYLLFQIPCAAYASQRSARRIVFCALILWGILSSLTGVISNFPLLLVDRFCLGIAEGVVMPAMLIYLSNWFSKTERSRANVFLMLGNPATLLWASIASGYLVQRVGWQMMFIAEGAPSVLWAFVWWRLARDTPRAASWISPREADQLEERFAGEQRQLTPAKSYWAAFSSPPVIILSLQLFFWSIGLYGLVLWLPKIIHDRIGGSLGTAGLYSAAPNLLGILLALGASFASDRFLRRKMFVWPFLLLGSLGFLSSSLLGASHFAWAYGCLVLAGGCIYAGYAPFFALVPELVPKNVAGASIALINSAGALGSFLGVYFAGWLNALTHSASASLLGLAGALALAAGCMACLRAR